MEYKSVDDNFVVKVEKVKEEKKTSSGIIIPDVVSKKSYYIGTIIDADSDYKVLFDKADGYLIEENEEYFIFSVLLKKIKARVQ